MWFNSKVIQLVNIIFQPFAILYILWCLCELTGILIRILKQLRDNNQVPLIIIRGKLAFLKALEIFLTILIFTLRVLAQFEIKLRYFKYLLI